MDTAKGGATPSAVDKAAMLLEVLSDDVRRQVMSRMDPRSSQLVLEAIQRRSGTVRDFNETIASKRRLMRTTAVEIQERALDNVARSNDADVNGLPPSPGVKDPLDELRSLHPAAVARALRGERAEAWAIVLARVSEPVAGALRSFLEPHAAAAIDRAAAQLQQLPDGLRSTVERALRETVVPRALREQRAMMSGSSGSSGTV